MGLVIGGYLDRAGHAFDWLARIQNTDGSWFASYRGDQPEDRTRDANMSAYLTVALYHYYLITGDIALLEHYWPNMDAAIDFVLQLQGPGGEIFWAISPEGHIDPMALLTGSSSIYFSLKCALRIAHLLKRRPRRWANAAKALQRAIAHRPHLFNMTKARYSMDWFYPVLAGAVSGAMARRRLRAYWKKFVVEGQGVLCVSDQPWVTLAETSELVLALSAIGNHDQASIVFDWIADKRFDDASCWCGYTYPDMTCWPQEKYSWSNGAFLLAADAVYRLTPAAGLFSHSFWLTDGGD
jgi:hypothetical protein